MWEQLFLKAAKDGSVEELVVALTERNVNIDSRPNGWTALMIAAFWGRTRIVVELLLSGATLGLTNANGNTAETIARHRNQLAVANLLEGMRLPSHPLLKPGRKRTAPLTAIDRFVAGLPLQPNPQPEHHKLFHDEGMWPAIKKRLKEWAAAKANDGQAKAIEAKLLEVACANKFSNEIIRYLGELCPGAVETMAETFTLQAVVSKKFPAICVQWVLADPNAIKANGDILDTVLHALAAAGCSSDAEARNANTVFFTLVERGASLTATNALRQTPAEASQHDADEGGTMRKYRHHLIASFREIAAYKKCTHLSVKHFRDWTTVSHAWCTPSAKLVALTVLMVGETYKRGLLPRLPMDCWYFILNCIPRHELRLGGCEPAEEQDARTKYLAILREARAKTGQKELDALIAKRDALNLEIDALTRKYAAAH